jgi:hypothetical protein
MNAREYLEALTATVARLEARDVKILEVRYEQPNSWCLAVQKEEAKLEAFYEGGGSFTISRFRRSAANVEYWDSPELVHAEEDYASIQQLLIRVESEIAARFQTPIQPPQTTTGSRAPGRV